MGQAKCISGNIVKAIGGMSIAQGGAITASPIKQNIPLSELTTAPKGNYGSSVFRAVSAASSGNLGTIKPYVAGSFAYMAKGQYILQVAGRFISGVATTNFQSPSTKVALRPDNRLRGVHTGFLTVLTWTGGHDGLPIYTKTVSSQAPNFLSDDNFLNGGFGEFAIRTGSPTVILKDYIVPNSD